MGSPDGGSRRNAEQIELEAARKEIRALKKKLLPIGEAGQVHGWVWPWMPIETAPTDGTQMLLFDEYIFLGSWQTDEWVSDTTHVLSPSHWQPLPKAPDE